MNAPSVHVTDPNWLWFFVVPGISMAITSNMPSTTSPTSKLSEQEVWKLPDEPFFEYQVFVPSPSWLCLLTIPFPLTINVFPFETFPENWTCPLPLSILKTRLAVPLPTYFNLSLTGCKCPWGWPLRQQSSCKLWL